ncbi:MAG: M1 family aminopeptidase [Promethearchaeota archaeon]
MKTKKLKFSFILIGLFLINCYITSVSIFPFEFHNDNYISNFGDEVYELDADYPKIAQITGNFSSYNLSIIMDEVSSSVEGNLTVNFYNNDNINFTQIPFHIYLSGMAKDTRPGFIEIVNVTDQDNQNIAFPFEVYSNQQIMWVNLTAELEPQKIAKFIIRFNSTIPDGGIDRANSHGSNETQSRIYKFGSFYPIPCVYDNEDGWNTDSYLTTGDPFYFDMAYYNFFIEAPNGMIIAATGKLEEKLENGATTWYHFNPVYPVREVTFSASRYFQVQSKISNGVNVSTYFLLKDNNLWNNYALNHAENALILFNNSFGTYPYPTLNVVEEYTDYGGMEYPNQVYISESIGGWAYPLEVRRRLLEKIIVHEVCHQWWYNLVGNDEIDVGFLDEGLTCWSTDYYGEHYYGDWEFFQYTRYIDEVRVYYAENGISSKINQSVYECLSTNTDFYYVAYHKAPLIFEKLRQALGLTAFLEGIKLYFESYQFELVILSDLKQAFEDAVGQSLDWFFFPWFENDYLPKYAFSNHTYNQDTKRLSLTIEDTNEPWNDYEYSQQISLAIYDASGQLLLSEYVWVNGTTEFEFILPNDPRKVSLLYNNYVLVQLSSDTDLTLDLQIDLSIPGYDLTILILVSLQVIAISIVIVRKRLKRLF